jgi:hypothetical protein
LEKRRIEMGDLFVRLLRTHVRIVKKKQGILNTTRAYTDRFIINGTTHEMSISWPNQKAKKTQKRKKENQALDTLSVST